MEILPMNGAIQMIVERALGWGPQYFGTNKEVDLARTLFLQAHSR
jgi:hypothetical protein